MDRISAWSPYQYVLLWRECVNACHSVGLRFGTHTVKWWIQWDGSRIYSSKCGKFAMPWFNTLCRELSFRKLWPLKGRRRFEALFVSGCTWRCSFDNFRCSQWWKFHQNNIWVAVLYLHCKLTPSAADCQWRHEYVRLAKSISCLLKSWRHQQLGPNQKAWRWWFAVSGLFDLHKSATSVSNLGHE